MSDLDRWVRVLIGAVLIVAVLTGFVSGALAVLAMIVGLIGLITGLVARCPAYALLGVSTYGRDAGSPHGPSGPTVRGSGDRDTDASPH